MRKIVLIFIGVSVVYCHLITAAYAKEITILYTGDTHAMLYPCNCPKEPDGGVARRAALVNQLRKENPNTLLLDTGSFFAGGVMDEYTQNSILDKERALVALKAMQIMRYDAVAIGSDEFNFGRAFLDENIAKSNLAFLSCNAFLEKSDKIIPYIIKETGGVKFGIIGLTSISATGKSGGLKFTEPKAALSKAIEDLKKKQPDIIVVLSNAGEVEPVSLLKEVQGIDILIIGQGRSKEKPLEKINSTLVLRTSWQGRHLGKLTITLAGNKTKTYKAEDLRLSDKIKDDPSVSEILPRCFSDFNCRNAALMGVCNNPGKLNAACEFPQVSKVGLLVITPKDCHICDTKAVVDYLKAQVPGLSVSYLYYPEARATKLIKDLDVIGLPAYVLDKEIDKEQAFINLKVGVYAKSGFYILKPEVGGISYFLNRKNIKGNFDVFISLYDKNIVELLEAIKDFKPNLHFLATQQQNGIFDAAKGSMEVEEYLRGVCIQKYYPQIFWDYITCRSKNINSSWWEDCLSKFDSLKIKDCARGQEGAGLLRDNISLNKEIKVLFGPTYLLDNQLVFGTQGVPTKEEFKKIIKR